MKQMASVRAMGGISGWATRFWALVYGGRNPAEDIASADAVESQEPLPLEEQTAPPLDQYCDLVLTGGVINGMVYPGLILEMARRYRFRSLGGTSVGAIAASVAAACEYRRRFGSLDGFNEVLRKMPKNLSGKEKSGGKLHLLENLFQPEKGMERLFGLAVQYFSARPSWRAPECKADLAGSFKGFRDIVGLIFKANRALYLVMPFGLLVFWGLMMGKVLLPFESGWANLVLAILAGLLVVIAVLGLMVLDMKRDIQKLMNSVGFGFCSGYSGNFDSPGITDWMHEGIQAAADLPLDRPLTFKDLWEAPGGPVDGKGQKDPRSIDLRMITTSISHERPYELPHVESSTRLFFRPSELALFFPEAIISHLKQVSEPYRAKKVLKSIDPSVPDYIGDPAVSKASTDLLELPSGDLPIVVAARLSMCFPVLFKAIPLWAIDYEKKYNYSNSGNRIPPGFRQCWFADGGLASNFPIHFFDKPVPRWPTFGVFLASKSSNNDPQKGSNSWVSTFHTTGAYERWAEIASLPKTGGPDLGDVVAT
jgi:predicted acylesterase/phospholipase RssA